MGSYKKYISMGVSIILLPLAKIALNKIMDKGRRKSEQNSTRQSFESSVDNKQTSIK